MKQTRLRLAKCLGNLPIFLRAVTWENDLRATAGLAGSRGKAEKMGVSENRCPG